MGRKTLYDAKRFPKLAERWAKLGLNHKQISKNLGISHQTFNEYKNKYPEFAESVKKGRNESNLEVVNSCFKMCIGFTKVIEQEKVLGDGTKVKHKQTIYVQPNPKMIEFWLKHRMGEYFPKDGVNDTDGVDELVKTIKAGMNLAETIRKGDGVDDTEE